jgi:uncharacterized protein YndB with AHSA1/START domain
MPRTDTASRVIAASAEQIYGAWIDAEALTAWLPPDGMTATFDRFDLRSGGSYRMVLTYVDPSRGAGKATADTDIVEARVVELVPNNRMVQEVDFVSDDPAVAGTMRMTWQLTPVDGATLVEFIAEDVPDGISAEDHASGLSSSLSNLADHLGA